MTESNFLLQNRKEEGENLKKKLSILLMIQSAQISLDIENLDFAFNCDIEVFI